MNPVLRGRSAELDAIGAALDGAAAGEQRILLIDGEAGIGKSRLLAEAAEQATARGFLVAAACGDEMERSRPFGVIADALGCTRTAEDPRRHAIASLLTGRDRVTGPVTVSSDPGLRYRVVDALCDLVSALAADQPVLLALDDLQWSDQATLVSLTNICQATVGLPVAVLGGHQPIARTSPLAGTIAALDDAGACHLSLAPLDDTAVHQVVADLLGAEPEPSLLDAVAGATGNPLFVIELIQSILGDPTAGRGTPLPVPSAATVPDSVRLAILRRLSTLPDTTLETLRFAALLGASFSPQELAVVTDRGVGDLLPALEAAITVKVIEEHDAALRFRHDLIREAIYADMTPTLRTALHREAAQRLSAASASVCRVAEQFARGAGPGDTEAADWFTRAARQAVTTAPETAVDFFARAAEVTAPDDPARDRALTERADALMLAGQAGDAVDACRALLAGAGDAATRAGARLRLGSALLVNGHPNEALTELDVVIGDGGGEDPRVVAGLAEVATARLWLGDFPGADAAAERALPAAERIGDARTVAASLATRSVTACMRAQMTRALALNDEALARAEASSDLAGHRFPVYATRGWILLELDRLEEARQALDQGRRLCDRLGVRWPLATYQAYLAVVRFSAGAWDDAVTELEAGIEFAEESGVTYALKPSYSALALIRLFRNDLAGTRRALERTTAMADRGSRLFDYRALWAEALATEAEGDPHGAYAMLAERWGLCREVSMAVDYPVVGPDLVRLSLDAGDTELAEQVTATVIAAAADIGVPSIVGAALRCRGLLEDDAEIMARAVDAYASGPRLFETALTCEEAAAAAERAGDRDRARGLLEQASGLFDRLDASRGTARVDAQLRRLGVRRGRRGPRNRPRWGWQSLTPTESIVAELVGEGLTNPQIAERLYVSRRTVQTHVSHIFTKLEIGSRARLATLVAEHRDADPADLGPSPVAPTS